MFTNYLPSRSMTTSIFVVTFSNLTKAHAFMGASKYPNGPKWNPNGPKWTEMEPKWTQMEIKWTQMEIKWTQMELNFA